LAAKIFEREISALSGESFFAGADYRIGFDPELKDCVEIAKAIVNSQADCIVAVGGGSVIDAAKFSSAIAGDIGDAELYFYQKKPLPKRKIGLIAAPTTAGTGSEVTRVAVINNGEEKRTINDTAFYADIALIDPVFTRGMGARLTAISGLDALSHALEACWSINNTPLTDLYAGEAIRLLASNLEAALKDPNDFEARSKTSYAALLAGLAFAVTKTAAVHAISYPLSEIFHLPHGEACALTLKEFLSINMSVRLRGILERAGADEASLKERIERIQLFAGLTTSLPHIPEKLIDRSLAHPLMKNNPVAIDANSLKNIFNRINENGKIN
jgi:Alcohol dehydrogenase, class IV